MAAVVQWRGKEIIQGLANRGVFIPGRSMHGVARATLGVYKYVGVVVEGGPSRLGAHRGAAETKHLR
ncbi:MAG TPA: hypothetical protein VLX11_14915 [Candidatus Acidoferrales bacterium]|nr:hypothetical protein [Candidatus Acidoferrales bacterium]